MHGDGIVNLGADALVFQICAQRISLRRPHGELVEDMFIALLGCRQGHSIVQPGFFKQALVLCGIASPALRPAIQALELDLPIYLQFLLHEQHVLLHLQKNSIDPPLC